MRAFRFGVQAHGSMDARGWRELARRAEGLGYDTLCVPDHFEQGSAPLVALAVAAEATSSLRVGTLVLGNDFRHPAAVAKEAATLDVLSEGRFELGIGAGWQTRDYELTGIPMDRPGRRIERLGEAVAIIKGLLAGETVTFSGRHYTIDGLAGLPQPVRPGGPPLLVAGGAERVLRLAARTADIVGINPSMVAGVIDERVGPSATVSATAAKIDWIRQEAGERFAGLELHTRVHVASITDDAAGLADALAPALGLNVDQALASPHSLIGTESVVVDKLIAQREELGISYIGLPAEAMEEMAPVVARLAGA
ncbi:TIGR03621 family F420-dependent LLM class oxidoreductase [Candidatus Poriferisocius sp.]|uniref:TIGR03621 family F420-dependent LLM class oxidoreductase n=1 Tax=Candidatus Poriferisocius sp. TaxID=3101276 RepID=UPI003B5B41CD